MYPGLLSDSEIGALIISQTPKISIRRSEFLPKRVFSPGGLFFLPSAELYSPENRVSAAISINPSPELRTFTSWLRDFAGVTASCYPVTTASASIRRTILVNSHSVRWLSASIAVSNVCKRGQRHSSIPHLPRPDQPECRILRKALGVIDILIVHHAAVDGRPLGGNTCTANYRLAVTD